MLKRLIGLRTGRAAAVALSMGSVVVLACDDAVCPLGTVEVSGHCVKQDATTAGTVAADPNPSATGPSQTSAVGMSGAQSVGAAGVEASGTAGVQAAGPAGAPQSSGQMVSQSGSAPPAPGSNSNSGTSGSGNATAGSSSSSVPSGECQPGEASCDGLRALYCVAGKWMTGPMCPFLCKEGECTGMCMPGTKQCTDNVPQTCDMEGVWKDDGPACANVCSEGGCTGACMPGAKQCNRNVVQTCSANGAWESGQSCMYVCAPEGECSGECTPNDKRCSEDTPQKCSAQGRWELNGAPCTNVCTDGACTGECVPGSRTCSGTTPQRCNDSGTWERAGSPCPNVCLDGVCTGNCKPNAVRCSSNGTPEKCDERGNWNSNGSQCPYACTDGACTGECNPGGTTPHCIAGHKEQTCVNHQWTGGTISKACGAECIPGQMPMCKGTTTTQLICNDAGVFVEKVTKGQCGAVCTPGEGGCILQLVSQGASQEECTSCSKTVISGAEDTLAAWICGADGKKMGTYCASVQCADLATYMLATCNSGRCSTTNTCK